MKNQTIALIALLSSISINAIAQDVEGTVIRIEPAYKMKYEQVYLPNSNDDKLEFRSEREIIKDKNFITIKDKSDKIYEIEADSKYKVVKGQRIIIEING